MQRNGPGLALGVNSWDQKNIVLVESPSFPHRFDAAFAKLLWPLGCCWYRYGIKEVKGINRLSGPGLETKDSPGMLSGGGKWPGRSVINLAAGNISCQRLYVLRVSLPLLVTRT